MILIPFQRLEVRDTPGTFCQRYKDKDQPDCQYLIWLSIATLQPECIYQET